MRTEIDAARIEAKGEYQRGLREGVTRESGAALSKGMTTMPKITALTLVDEEVGLVASYAGQEPPVIDAWLQLEVVGTGEVKGAVVVHKIVEDEQLVVLKCCERRVPGYWARLAQRAGDDAEPPKGVRLKAYEVATASKPTATQVIEVEGPQA